MAVTPPAMSLPFLVVFLAISIIGVGILLYYVVERRGRNHSSSAPTHVAQMGYGRERWQREYTLWQGVLHRLEIQAKYQNPVSARLQKEIAEAKAKIAEAEQAIKKA